jgi:hypothetical protein
MAPMCRYFLIHLINIQTGNRATVQQEGCDSRDAKRRFFEANGSSYLKITKIVRRPA